MLSIYICEQIFNTEPESERERKGGRPGGKEKRSLYWLAARMCAISLFIHLYRWQTEPTNINCYRNADTNEPTNFVNFIIKPASVSIIRRDSIENHFDKTMLPISALVHSQTHAHKHICLLCEADDVAVGFIINYYFHRGTQKVR